MTDILMMPREITLGPFSVKRRIPCHIQGVTSLTSIMSFDCHDRDHHHYAAQDHPDDLSSLAPSMGDEGLESGFASFADFLRYASQATIAAQEQQQHQDKGPWRRRRKCAALRQLGNLLKTNARRVQDLLYGLCGMIVFSLVNVAVAFGLLFFLIF